MPWIQATNPAVSLPNLDRIRRILRHPELFVVVQDAFLMETAQFADVVLPTALWGEKTGCFANIDRTVHISHRAVEPPGEARTDFAIFLDYARRMDLRDKDGAPLIKWTTPEGAFEAWKECSRGRPCDYTGLSFDKLSGGSGIPWPCNAEYPDGTPHLYTSLEFPTAPDYCESYGHDLITGGVVSPVEYKANNPAGRAMLKAAHYMPPFEMPDRDYPFFLTTGRLVYHFHTRTKTGRSQALNDAAPQDFVQISSADAQRLGIVGGDWIKVTSRRGKLEAQAQTGDVAPGEIFVPFHYGYWDDPERSRAANELTVYEWDPVSKQPHYKYAAVKLEKINAPSSTQPEKVAIGAAGAPAHGVAETLKEIKDTAVQGVKSLLPERDHIADYIGLLQEAERRLIKGFT